MIISPDSPLAGKSLIVNAVFMETTDGDHQRAKSAVNTTVSSPLHRLLWIDPQGECIATIALPAKHALPVLRRRTDFLRDIEEGLLSVAPNDPYPAMTLVAPENSDVDAHRRYALAHEIRGARWQRIRALAQDPSQAILIPAQRGKVITAAATAASCSRATLYALLRLFWQFGQTPDALLPHLHRCGAPGMVRRASLIKRGRPSLLSTFDESRIGMNVTDDIRDIIVAAGIRYYEREKMSLVAAYKEMLADSFSRIEVVGNDLRYVLLSENECPSLRQFKYWFRIRRDSPAGLEGRAGTRKYNLLHRVALQSSTDRVTGPGSFYQVDATIGDVYLLSSIVPGRIIGRPVIYIVIDAFSRMIVGLHVGLDGPSWLGMMLALENAFSSKIDFCRRFGITIDPALWPCEHICDSLLGDRGELLSQQGDHVVRSLNIELLNTGSWRADWKGIVECKFHTINDDVIHWMPGAVYDLRERGSPDYRRDATLTLQDFTRIMIKLALHHNTRKHIRGDDSLPLGYPYPASGDPTPLELWNWGILNRSGHLRAADPARVRANLLPGGQAAVTGKGIRYEGMYYAPLDLVNRESVPSSDHISGDLATWFLRNTGRKSQHVMAALDPRDVSTLYIRLHDGREIIPCTLIRGSRAYAGLSLAEVADARALRAMSNVLNANKEMSDDITFKRDVQSLVDDAEDRGVGRDDLTRADVRGIRATRAEERLATHHRDAWRPDNASGDDADATCPPRQAHNAISAVPIRSDGYVPPPNELSLLESLLPRPKHSDTGS